MPKKHIVTLTESDQEQLKKIINQGRELASVRKRATALRASHDGLSDEEASQISRLSIVSLCRLPKRYVQDGFAKALYGNKRGGQRSHYSEKDEAVLVALACSDAPKGRSCWTLELLAEMGER